MARYQIRQLCLQFREPAREIAREAPPPPGVDIALEEKRKMARGETHMRKCDAIGPLDRGDHLVHIEDHRMAAAQDPDDQARLDDHPCPQKRRLEPDLGLEAGKMIPPSGRNMEFGGLHGRPAGPVRGTPLRFRTVFAESRLARHSSARSP